SVAALLLALCLNAEPARAQAPRGVALIIGNGAYRGGIPALANPSHDATAFAGVAQRLGFATVLLLDANREEMAKALRSFALAAKGAGVAIIYYSGHGAEVGGRNLLLPVDFALQVGEAPSAMDARVVSLADVDGLMGGTAATIVLLIDACRNDPFGDAVLGGGTT